MKVVKELETVRQELKNKRKSEFLISDSEYHSELVKEIADLTNKMNEEKINAMKEVEKKYKEEIDSLQSEYALYLKLNS